MRENIVHALDLCVLGEWEDAKNALEGSGDPVAERLSILITQLQERQSDRERLQKMGRHELGNALSIAQANLEAMVDGVLEITPERLRDIRESLRTAGSLLVDLPETPVPEPGEKAPTSFDLSELLAAQVAMIRSAAEPKNVAIAQGDPKELARKFRDALLAAVRRAAPGGKITISID